MPVKFEDFHDLPLTVINKAIRAAEELAQSATVGVCVSCGAIVNREVVDAYNHQYGWLLVPEMRKQWLSIHCHKCGYDISLDKLGVRR
ncbi:MAG: hypothetical protein QNJ81_06805 [Acidimicrobiia bacterium]|nr:hypothetical protein [Acidimicrobiia bacterium]